MTITTGIVFGVTLVGMFWICGKMMKAIGAECIFCSGRARKLSNLPDVVQQQVLRYFQNVENRVPVDEAVFVCEDCHRVNDDSISANTPHGIAIRCKACGIATYLNDHMTCQACGARYEWTTFAECGKHRFLLPTRHNKNANNHIDGDA